MIRTYGLLYRNLRPVPAPTPAPAIRTLTVTPSLGRIKNARVILHNAANRHAVPLAEQALVDGKAVFGAVLFVAASVTATLAGSIELLVAARLVQGLGGTAGMVIGRAIILDRARGTEAARALSIMMLIGGIAAIIAPGAGGALKL